MIYLDYRNQILLSDYKDSSLKIVDIDAGNLVETIKNEYLITPMCLCTNSLNELFVFCDKRQLICILNEKFELIKLINDIPTVAGMCIDKENEDNLYFTQWELNKLSLISIENEKIIKSIDLNQPKNILMRRNKLYVISFTEWDYTVSSKRMLKEVVSGDNSIFILDKVKLEILNKIKFQEWLSPRGIHIDKNENIWTLAFKLDQQKNYSKYKHLFGVNKYGYVIQSLELNDVEWLADVLFLPKKLVLCDGNWVKIIKFD